MDNASSLTIAGDTSLGYYYLQQDKWKSVLERVEVDPLSFFEGVKPELSDSNHFILNLETVLSYTDGEACVGKEYCGIDDPDNTLEVLKDLKVSAVTLANNHALDFGAEKFKETLVHLHSAGIGVMGAGLRRQDALAPYCFPVVSNSVAYQNVYVLSALRASQLYSEFGFFADSRRAGVARATVGNVARQVERIREQDPEGFIIYYPHWQGRDYREVSERIINHCRQSIDAGVDMVIGHGTHAAGRIEHYNGKLIFHSIGNFVINSPGRYARMKAAPWSMLVRLDFSSMSSIDDGPEVSILPLNTDNRETGFNVAPLNDPREFLELIVSDDDVREKITIGSSSNWILLPASVAELQSR
jgi:poly-gamma-glutamate capsule biosynthesis protein CapA/YwtB (metallophosphatase superfamily)